MSNTKQTTETTPSGWAAERARAAAGDERAAGRFARLAEVLLTAEVQGEQFISFALANERAGLQRGVKGDAAGSWRLALQRTRQLADIGPWRVDAGRLALVLQADQ